jgi:hypothetical protein
LVKSSGEGCYFITSLKFAVTQVIGPLLGGLFHRMAQFVNQNIMGISPIHPIEQLFPVNSYVPLAIRPAFAVVDFYFYMTTSIQ